MIAYATTRFNPEGEEKYVILLDDKEIDVLKKGEGHLFFDDSGLNGKQLLIMAVDE